MADTEEQSFRTQIPNSQACIIQGKQGLHKVAHNFLSLHFWKSFTELLHSGASTPLSSVLQKLGDCATIDVLFDYVAMMLSFDEFLRAHNIVTVKDV